jgi:AraC-like DNA-binding protein
MERRNKARTFLGEDGRPPPNHENLRDIFPDYRKFSDKFICVYFRVRGIREGDFHDLVNNIGPRFLDKRLMKNSVLYSCVPGEYVLLFLAIKGPDHIKEFAEALMDHLRSIKDQVKEKESHSPLCPAAGLSNIRDTAERAIVEALNLMKYRVLLEHSAVICENDISSYENTYSVPGHCIYALKHALAERNKEALVSILDSIEAEVRSLKISYYCLENVYLQLLLPVNEASSLTKTKNQFVPAKDAYYFVNLTKLFAFVKEAYSGYTMAGNYMDGKSSAVSKTAIVHDIAASINENYNEYLTLELFAGEYGINPSYLSILFKEVMGCNFQKYLSQVRIRNAKEFLTSGRYNVGEVAEKTGYTSRFYFSKAFKKIEGLTPSEFMSMKDK